MLLVDLITYITRFQWDMAKYPIKQSLKNISEIISKASLDGCITSNNNVHDHGSVEGSFGVWPVHACILEPCHLNAE